MTETQIGRDRQWEHHLAHANNSSIRENLLSPSPQGPAEQLFRRVQFAIIVAAFTPSRQRRKLLSDRGKETR
jgi:hypothetical protein